MKLMSLLLATLTLVSGSLHAADYVHVRTSWDINATNHTNTNNDSKIRLGPTITAFRLQRGDTRAV